MSEKFDLEACKTTWETVNEYKDILPGAYAVFQGVWVPSMLAEIARLRNRLTDERYAMIQIALAADVQADEFDTANDLQNRVLGGLARLRAELAALNVQLNAEAACQGLLRDENESLRDRLTPEVSA